MYGFMYSALVPFLGYGKNNPKTSRDGKMLT